MCVTLIAVAVSTLVIYLVYKHRVIYNYFENHGLRYRPGAPLFGNSLKSVFFKRHSVEDIDEIYRAFPGEKYVGFVELMEPVVLIRDPEIIKEITVKHFDHFVDHKQLFSPEIEPMFGGSLFLMRGEKWKDMRTTLSPAFTSSKMKMMMPFMVNITNNIIDYLKDHTDEDIDVDDLVRRYTNDVIASTAYGVHINSLVDRENEFYRTGQDMFAFSLRQNLKFSFMIMFPKVAEKLGMTVFPSQIQNFFTNLVNQTIDYREKNNVVRTDMIQLLMEAAKGTLKAENDESDIKEDTKKPTRQWSRSDIMSQVFIFFAAGFESSATAVGMTIHELAINQDVQEKLYQEIKEYQEQHQELKFDSIPSLKYLECVVNETLRKWSPALIMDRECLKPFELPPPREGAKPVKLQPGDIVYNAVNSIHMDPEYFPDPDVFDPDRFRDDKRHIQPFTFMPFGMGPRNCIGLRFAYLEVKVLLYYLLLNYKILKCQKTTDPIKLQPHNINIKALGGSWVRFELRK